MKDRPFDNAAYELITHVNDLVLSRWESVTDTHVGVFGGHAGAELAGGPGCDR